MKKKFKTLSIVMVMALVAANVTFVVCDNLNRSREIMLSEVGIHRRGERVPLQHGAGVGLAEFTQPALHQPGGRGITHRKRQFFCIGL